MARRPATLPLPMRLSRFHAMLLVLSFAAAGVVGCRSRPDDVREWRPSDHGQNPDEVQPDPNLPPLEDNDPTTAALALYAAQCANCHGRAGRGDGPAGMALRPPDFTAAAFQSARNDEELRAAIVRGRGAMPAFGETIRPEGIDALVRLIRQMGRGTAAAAPH